jgi:hypothetical protein
MGLRCGTQGTVDRGEGTLRCGTQGTVDRGKGLFFNIHIHHCTDGALLLTQKAANFFSSSNSSSNHNRSAAHVYARARGHCTVLHFVHIQLPSLSHPISHQHSTPVQSCDERILATKLPCNSIFPQRASLGQNSRARNSIYTPMAEHNLRSLFLSSQFD